MYMLVFVTLIVAIIGGYGQVYTALVSRIMSQQSGTADAMFQWHASAVGMTSSAVSTASITSAAVGGCSLTVAGSGNLSQTQCINNATATPIYVGMASQGGLAYCNGSNGLPCITTLPQGYLSPPYTFYSVVFQSGSTDYVLTYVSPPPSGGDKYNLGLLCLPGDATGVGLTCAGTGSRQVPTTFIALYRQLARSLNMVPNTYGTVTSAGVLKTMTVKMNYGGGTILTPLTYTIPSYIPVGAIGIITQVAPCSTC